MYKKDTPFKKDQYYLEKGKQVEIVIFKIYIGKCRESIYKTPFGKTATSLVVN